MMLWDERRANNSKRGEGETTFGGMVSKCTGEPALKREQNTNSECAPVAYEEAQDDLNATLHGELIDDLEGIQMRNFES